ncbi:hypothetical protein GIB67_033078 [Kingdonia uniflora]|uniref:Helicase Helix-turn-helix domain-containing protein n=1 Tax=Kingdonia uniflora TaxID=39325 RepID=A0A7J7MYW7_9MAGN|nr:hypothetical protein GIB67_033078 [Kingdonia uniflora]
MPNCVDCESSDHLVQDCPDVLSLREGRKDQANAMYQRPNNQPFNGGWNNNSNNSNSRGNRNYQGGSSGSTPYQPHSQVNQHQSSSSWQQNPSYQAPLNMLYVPPHNRNLPPPTTSLEDTLKAFMQVTQSSIAKLEGQIGQMATEISTRDKGMFPSQTQANPKGNTEHPRSSNRDGVNAIISLRSGTKVDNLVKMPKEPELEIQSKPIEEPTSAMKLSDFEAIMKKEKMISELRKGYDFDQKMENSEEKVVAVIMVGGPTKGTSFRPLSFRTPKPLIPLAGSRWFITRFPPAKGYLREDKPHSSAGAPFNFRDVIMEECPRLGLGNIASYMKLSEVDLMYLRLSNIDGVNQHLATVFGDQILRDVLNLSLGLDLSLDRRESKIPTSQRKLTPEKLEVWKMWQGDGLTFQEIVNRPERPVPVTEQVVYEYVFEAAKEGFNIDWNKFCDEIGMTRLVRLKIHGAISKIGSRERLRPIKDELPEYWKLGFRQTLALTFRSRLSARLSYAHIKAFLTMQDVGVSTEDIIELPCKQDNALDKIKRPLYEKHPMTKFTWTLSEDTDTKLQKMELKIICKMQSKKEDHQAIDILLAEIDIYELFAFKHCKGRKAKLALCED